MKALNPLFPSFPQLSRIYLDPTPGDNGAAAAEAAKASAAQQVVDKLTDNSGNPKFGDVIKIGDKLYTAKEIEALESGRGKLEKDLETTRAEQKATDEIFKNVWADPENPNREALKKALMKAGKTADQADSLIVEELGAEGEETVEKEPEAPKDPWVTKAWINTEFKKAAKGAFEGHETLNKFVEAIRKREAGDSTDKAVLAEATEAATMAKNEILSGLAIRADRILKQRVANEGEAGLRADPVGWFEEAMKQAADEEAKIARRRYGDPNRIGLSPSQSTEDPVDTWLNTRDVKKDNTKTHDAFGDALAAAILQGARGGRTV